MEKNIEIVIDKKYLEKRIITVLVDTKYVAHGNCSKKEEIEIFSDMER
jgi:hypothetical protein